MIRQIARLRKIVLTLIIGLGGLWTTSAQAANNNIMDHLYFGAKAGLMMFDAPGFGDAINIGGFVGAPVARLAQGTISVEGELTTSLISGDIGYLGLNGHWRNTTLAGYGVFRTHGQIYFKGKAGILFQNISVSNGGIPGSYSGTDSSVSLGVGGGMHLSGGQSLELEYTIINSDMSFLSIGYKF